MSSRTDTPSPSPRSQSWRRTNSGSSTDARTGSAAGDITNRRTPSTMTAAPPSPTAARNRSRARPARQTSGPRCGSSPHAPEPAPSVSKIPPPTPAPDAAVVEPIDPPRASPSHPPAVRSMNGPSTFGGTFGRIASRAARAVLALDDNEPNPQHRSSLSPRRRGGSPTRRTTTDLSPLAAILAIRPPWRHGRSSQSRVTGAGGRPGVAGQDAADAALRDDDLTTVAARLGINLHILRPGDTSDTRSSRRIRCSARWVGADARRTGHWQLVADRTDTSGKQEAVLVDSIAEVAQPLANAGNVATGHQLGNDLCGAYVLWYAWQLVRQDPASGLLEVAARCLQPPPPMWLNSTCHSLAKMGAGDASDDSSVRGSHSFSTHGCWPSVTGLVRIDGYGRRTRRHAITMRAAAAVRQESCNPPGNLRQRHRLASCTLHNERPCPTSPIRPFSAHCAASRARSSGIRALHRKPRRPKPARESGHRWPLASPPRSFHPSRSRIPTPPAIPTISGPHQCHNLPLNYCAAQSGRS